MSAAPNGLMKPRSLGSKSRSFMPLTPRSVKPNQDSRNDFAERVTQQAGRSTDGPPPHKKFRSSAAPKGSKLAQGYVDRARERLQEQQADGDDKATRLKRLEEMYKLQQIDEDTFEKLKDELHIGGDLSSTHLVKGLDFKLLERVRRGEDVNQSGQQNTEPENQDVDVDVDDELDQALESGAGRVNSVNHEADAPDDADTTEAAQGVSTVAPMTRDELLQRLKQNRKNPNALVQDAPAPAPAIDRSRFRKLESSTKPNKRKFTESINGRRREVLVITDKKGNVKRKTRWIDPEPDQSHAKADAAGAWGGDLPAEVLAKQKAAAEEAERQADEEEDEDIFGGVAKYDPLAGLESDDDEEATDKPKDSTAEHKTAQAETGMQAGVHSSKPRNYFSTGNTDEVDEQKPSGPDPTFLAALKRAAQIKKQEDSQEGQATGSYSTNTDENEANSDRNKALLKKLQQRAGHDDYDLDMGFGGGSRYDDEDDDGEGKQKLSQWHGIGNDEEEDARDTGEGGASQKRKRGGKKKKGDKNSYADLMSVIEAKKKS